MKRRFERMAGRTPPVDKLDLQDFAGVPELAGNPLMIRVFELLDTDGDGASARADSRAVDGCTHVSRADGRGAIPRPALTCARPAGEITWTEFERAIEIMRDADNETARRRRPSDATELLSRIHPHARCHRASRLPHD